MYPQFKNYGLEQPIIKRRIMTRRVIALAVILASHALTSLVSYRQGQADAVPAPAFSIESNLPELMALCADVNDQAFPSEESKGGK